MKDIIQELIRVKGKELAGMGIAILLIAAGFLAFHFYTQGGDPFVPEEVTTTRAKINKSLSRGINDMEDTIDSLNELLILEKEGNKSEIIAKVPTYKTDMAQIGQSLLTMPQDIQIIADLLPQIRPRNASKPLEDALGAAAQASIELLHLREDMVALYDGLEAYARGEEVKEYNLIVDRVNSQSKLINSLYDTFKTNIATFRKLTQQDE